MSHWQCGKIDIIYLSVATKEVVWKRIDSNRWLDENNKNYIDIEEDMELELLVQEFELEPEKYGKVDEKNINLTMLKTPTNKFLKTLNKITI